MKNKIVPIVVVVFMSLLAGIFVIHQQFESKKNNYLASLNTAYLNIDGIKTELDKATGKLSANSETDTTGDLINVLNNGTETLKTTNEMLSNIEIPDKEKYSDVNKKLLECLQMEYNLFERIKDTLGTTDEYSAKENQKHTKELMTNLKEQSAMLTVEGNDFGAAFDVSLYFEKIGSYLDAKAQLRYEKDDREQKERERIQNTYYVTYSVPYNNAPIYLSNNNMTVHVGQCIYLTLASDSRDPGPLRWMTFDGPLHNNSVEMELMNRGLGAKFTAVVPGQKYYQLVPNYSDWERSAKFYITVVP